MENKTTALGTRPIGPLVFHYALPAVMGLVLYGLQNVIDGIIVGRFIGLSDSFRHNRYLDDSPHG